MSKLKPLTSSLISLAEKHPTNIRWDNLCTKYDLPFDFIKTHHKRIHWDLFWMYQKLSSTKILLLQQFITINWEAISLNETLPIELMDSYSDNIKWSYVSVWNEIPKEVYLNHSHRLSWWLIARHANISEWVMENMFEPHLCRYLSHMVRNTTVSLSFKLKYHNKIFIGTNYKISKTNPKLLEL